MGREHAIVIVATGFLRGSGLPEEDRYPSRLDTALRARGIDSKIAIVRSDTLQGLEEQIDALAVRPEVAVLPGHDATPEVESALRARGISLYRLEPEAIGDGGVRRDDRNDLALSVPEVEDLVVRSADAIAERLGKGD